MTTICVPFITSPCLLVLSASSPCNRCHTTTRTAERFTYSALIPMSTMLHAACLCRVTHRSSPKWLWPRCVIISSFLPPFANSNLCLFTVISCNHEHISFLSLSPSSALWSLRVVLGTPQHNFILVSHLRARLMEVRFCHVAGTPACLSLGTRRGPASPCMSSPFPQVVEHSVVPSCFQL